MPTYCIMQLHQYHAKGIPILLTRHGLLRCLQDMGGQIDRIETDQHVLHVLEDGSTRPHLSIHYL